MRTNMASCYDVTLKFITQQSRAYIHNFGSIFSFSKKERGGQLSFGEGGGMKILFFILLFIFCIMTRNSSDRLNMYYIFLLFQRSSYRCHRDLRPPFSSKQKTKEWMEELEKERIRSFSHFLIDRFFCVMYVRSPT